MTSTARTPNHDEGLSAKSTITGQNEYLTSTSGVLNVSGGGSGGGAVTIADGADIAEGATADAAVTAGSAGSVSGKLRTISSDISSLKTTLPLPTGATTAANQTNGNQKTQVTNFVASSLVAGQQAVTGTATALSGNALAQGVTVEALSANTISVFVGPSGVTTSTGLELPPGSAVTLPVSNTNLVFVIASTTGASVSFAGN